MAKNCHVTKRQCLQISWQVHTLETLVEPGTKGQVLQSVWQAHSLKGHIELVAKNQTFEAFWKMVQITT
jgi:hypothetical protein